MSGSKRTTLFGPPGSGKTTTLSRWAKSAAQKHGGENIMICSLTKTAATEIQSRDTGVLKENVGTLHAHCLRAIMDKYEGRYRVLGPKDAEEWNKGKVAQWCLPVKQIGQDSAQVASGESIIAQCDLYRAQRIPVAKWPKRMRDFWNNYVQFKEASKLIDFTDMIQIGLDSIDCPLDYVILDEAQDSSALEFALLEKWAEQCKGVVIAGDDDQAAYEWRGASVNAFLGFAEDQRVLPRTYRMPRNVKEYADRWIKQISNRKMKEYEARAEGGQVSELGIRHPALIAEEALGLSQKGTVMILTTCGYMLNKIVKTLIDEGIPFHNPYRIVGEYASQWNPLMTGRGSSVTIADAVRAFLQSPWSYRAANSWIREMSSQHLVYGTKASLKRRSSDDSLMPVAELSSCLGPEALSKALSGDMAWWLSTFKDKNRMDMAAMRHSLMRNLPSLNATPKIIVGTIHSVKGGQADNVILMPDLSPQAKEDIDEHEDRIIRQMYIGMTRAKENLFLAAPGRRESLQWI